MKPVLILLLLGIIAAPVLAADYMGSGIQLGGSGTNITQVTTTAGQTASPEATTVSGPTGSLSIESVPAGATIVLDGTERGVTPATISGLAAGKHSLYLKLTGYIGIAEQAEVKPGQTTTVTKYLESKNPTTKASPGFEAILSLSVLGLVLILARRTR